MPHKLGAQSERIASVRDLLSRKGRAKQGAFAFEGATLLDEAVRSSVAVRALYVTAEAYDGSARVQSLERDGVPVYFVGERTFAKISDVETPTGILAVADLRIAALADIVACDGVTLILADVSDPGNVGTLLRSAEAFGASGVILGDGGVDPYHPKVVRAAMGALFRLTIALADPDGWAQAAREAGVTTLGLAVAGEPLAQLAWTERIALVVGQERRGLARWEAVCDRRTAIPMAGAAESLNAAVAGSIALYEAARSSLASGRKTL